MPGQDQESEFDSEDEDLEFQLYQQLYFEPNPDADETNIKSTSPSQEHHKGVSFAVNGDKQYEQDYDHQRSQTLDPKHGDRSRTLYSSPSTTLINEKQSTQINYCITNDNHELRLTNLSVESRTKIAQNNLNNTQKVPGGSDHVKDGINLMNRNSLHSVRERLSSTCSDGSIPGSVPLDRLYCNILTSDDEDDDINNKLIMKDNDINNSARYKEKCEIKSNERKRRYSCSDDEAGDSRCDNLINVARKSVVKKPIIYQVEGDSNSDEELYVIPTPKPSHPEILTLESSSEDEGKQKNKEESRVKRKGNKYIKIDHPFSAPKNEKENSKEVRNVSKSKGEQGKFESFRITSDSESDSNDVCFPEATKGTDLTLNIDKSLSGWVKTLTKDSDNGKKKGKVTKEVHKKMKWSSVDFTKGRPITARKPSCEKWTQSMATFYDSDISEDFNVSEIHFQQSDSPSEWHLNEEDLQITQRRRYYNAPVKCKRCREEGHSVDSCSRVPVCRLCSKSDHVARRDCPENCCFKCGGDPHYFCRDTNLPCACSLCGLRGHLKYICPDLWRQFHLTTSGSNAQAPTENITRPQTERYCYNCGKQGHYGHHCPHASQNRSYTLVPQSISSCNYPVNITDGGFIVNLDETQSPQEEDVTRVPISSKDVSKIIGVKGKKVKSIIKQTGARVHVLHGKQPEVLLFGSLEARLKAKEKIRILQDKKKKRVDLVEQLNLNNTYSNPMRNVHSESKTSTSFNGIVEEAAGNTNKNSWCAKFVSQLDRKVCSVKRITRTLLTNLTVKEISKLNGIINKLKTFRLEMMSKPSLEPSQGIKEGLSIIAKACLQSEKYIEKREIHRKIQDLHKYLKSCNSRVVPEHICDAIAVAVEPLYNLSSENYEVLLEHAESVRYNYFNKKKRKNQKLKQKIKQSKEMETNSTNGTPTKSKTKGIKKKKNKKKIRFVRVEESIY